jgi:hypothetical protein
MNGSLRWLWLFGAVVAVSKGGTNDASNLILLCPNCHDLVHEAARRFFGPSHNDASRREMDKSWEKFQEFRKSLRQAYDEFEATMIKVNFTHGSIR